MKKKKKTINAMDICEQTPTQRNLVMFEGMMNMLVTGNARYVTLTDLGMAIMNTRYTCNPTVGGMAIVSGSTSFSRCGFHTLYQECTAIFFLTRKTRSRNHCYWSV